MLKEYVLDGTRITSLASFYEEISEVLIPGAAWGKNLDAFDDILRGGLGTPEEGFTLRWTNSTISRENSGYSEAARQLELMLQECHPTNRDEFRRRVALARSSEGLTVFDWLVQIIEDHGAGGEQCADNVRLVLE